MTLLHDDFLNDRTVLLLEHLSDDVDLVVDDVLETVQLLVRQLFFVQHHEIR